MLGIKCLGLLLAQSELLRAEHGEPRRLGLSDDRLCRIEGVRLDEGKRPLRRAAPREASGWAGGRAAVAVAGVVRSGVGAGRLLLRQRVAEEERRFRRGDTERARAMQRAEPTPERRCVAGRRVLGPEHRRPLVDREGLLQNRGEQGTA